MEPGLRCVKNSDLHGLLFGSFSHGMPESLRYVKVMSGLPNTFCFGSVKYIFCSIESEGRLEPSSLYCLYSKEEEGIQY